MKMMKFILLVALSLFIQQEAKADKIFIVADTETGSQSPYVRAYAAAYRSVTGDKLNVKYLPGDKNGMNLMNYAKSVQNDNNTVLCFTPASMTLHSAVSNVDVNWIGTVAGSVSLIVAVKDSKINDFSQLQREEHFFGMSASRNGDAPYELMNKVLGTKFKIIRGYQVTADLYLAAKRKEIEVFTTNTDGLKTFDSSDIKILVQTNSERSPQFPNIPSWTEYVSDSEAKELYGLFSLRERTHKNIAMSETASTSMINLERTLFKKVMASEAYKFEIEKMKLDYSPGDYTKIEETVSLFRKYSNKIDDLMKNKGIE